MNKTRIDTFFEQFNISAYKVLASVLPYGTPLPVAWLTMRSAESFLGFAGWISFIFVFCLEGLGLWFTSLFVDSIIDVIRSRNIKTLGLVALFGAVVFVYVYILVNLNVTLKSSSADYNPALAQVITLLCYLPLLSGVGNAYYKWQLEQRAKSEIQAEKQEEKEYKIRQEKREDKIKSKMIERGMNPMLTQYQLDSPTPLPAMRENKKKDDWRLLTYEEKREVIHVLKIPEIMEKYGVGRATAYNWKSKKI